MRLQNTTQTSLQQTPAKAPKAPKADATPTFDADKFVSSQRNPQGDIGSGSGYGTGGSTSGRRLR